MTVISKSKTSLIICLCNVGAETSKIQDVMRLYRVNMGPDYMWYMVQRYQQDVQTINLTLHMHSSLGVILHKASYVCISGSCRAETQITRCHIQYVLISQRDINSLWVPVGRRLWCHEYLMKHYAKRCRSWCVIEMHLKCVQRSGKITLWAAYF